ncbi:Histone-lysine N-methyltransferase SETMAR [Eumeta japonica]|uniref:Histone-lysine N-methyltransferase SETMAR n=1 Tax=Eumeta variegata TaxID=151549 RepID=A0A4C1XAI0_EUMVA|nr:Histone-lysine N-methyltransferase SETMAR [Eumeta japonica]
MNIDVAAACTQWVVVQEPLKEGYLESLKMLSRCVCPQGSRYMSVETIRFLESQKFELLDHPPYSLDLAPNNFYVFPSVKNKLRGQRFSSREEAVDAFKMHVLDIVQSEWKKWHENWFQRMQRREANEQGEPSVGRRPSSPMDPRNQEESLVRYRPLERPRTRVFRYVLILILPTSVFRESVIFIASAPPAHLCAVKLATPRLHHENNYLQIDEFLQENILQSYGLDHIHYFNSPFGHVRTSVSAGAQDAPRAAAWSARECAVGQPAPHRGQGRLRSRLGYVGARPLCNGPSGFCYNYYKTRGPNRAPSSFRHRRALRSGRRRCPCSLIAHSSARRALAGCRF